jgi:putative transposase
VRTVYNDAIAARKAAYRDGLPFPSTAELDKRLITVAKRTTERSWLTEVSTVPLQQALRDCHAAYQNFFDSLAGRRRGARIGPPRFRRRSSRQTARYTRNGFSLRKNGKLYIAKVGEIKVAWSRELAAEPSSVTIIKTPTDKYYASFVVELDDGADVLEPIHDPEAETGIDLGLKDFAVLSGGRVIENPRFFKRMERKLKKTQRVLSRKMKGSANRAKARARLARVHEQIKDRRDDWLNQQVSTLVRENQALYTVKGLARGRAAKSIHDAALSMFCARLESKAIRAGRTFARVDRYFPSTQLCSACVAHTGPKGLEGLKVREWVCGCGVVHDRDRNAAVNILREGKRMVAAGQAETRNASGGQVRPGTPGTARNTPDRGQNEEPTRSLTVVS